MLKNNMIEMKNINIDKLIGSDSLIKNKFNYHGYPRRHVEFSSFKEFININSVRMEILSSRFVRIFQEINRDTGMYSIFAQMSDGEHIAVGYVDYPLESLPFHVEDRSFYFKEGEVCEESV